MHTVEANGDRAHFNPDLSGAVIIKPKNSDPVEVSGELIRKLLDAVESVEE